MAIKLTEFDVTLSVNPAIVNAVKGDFGVQEAIQQARDDLMVIAKGGGRK